MIRIYILSSSSVFLSTPSARRATADAAIQSLGFQDFYPRPPRGGRPCMAALNDWLKGISIHALREEGDVQHHANVFDLAISIHALREEGDWHSATKGDASPHFYPRPPRGGRLNAALCHRQSHLISIHALREEGDVCSNSTDVTALVFLSTPSARRATAKTETKSLFSYKLYNILHEFRRALIYSGSKNYPNHAKRLKNLVRRCRKDAENSPFAPGRKTQNNSRPSCSKGG